MIGAKMLFKFIVTVSTSIIILHYAPMWKAKEIYSAAVVEFLPVQISGLSLEERQMHNTDNYISILNNISVPLDIIVFPECTLDGDIFAKRPDKVALATLVPEPSDNVSPCDVGESVYNAFFVKLSCAAKQSHTYMVVNLKERTVCNVNGCAEDRWDVYNTNVVFDRQGRVISRYRKFHLFGEQGTNSTALPDVSTFTTDFKVTFGMFTCFDILFEQPFKSLLASGVKHFVYPTMWFSELPFLTALQTQQMFAEEHDIVFLAAGANDPKLASGGSGIYQGRNGALVSYINGTAGSKVLIHQIEKTWTGSSVSAAPNTYVSDPSADFHFLQENLTAYTLETIDLNFPRHAVCDSPFCCMFEVNATETGAKGNKTYSYRYAVHKGRRPYGTSVNAGIEVCAVIACTDETNVSSCGKRFTGDNITYSLEFQSISVSGQFEASQSDQYPNSLSGAFVPIEVSHRHWTSEPVKNDPTKVERTHTLIKSHKDVFTFGIYGRNYIDDVYHK